MKRLAILIALLLASPLYGATIQFAYPTGSDLYYILANEDGDWWDGDSFETPTSTYSTFDIDLPENGSGTGYFVASTPSASGIAWLILLDPDGGSPASTDQVVGNGGITVDQGDQDLAELLSLLQNTKPIVPNPARTWTPRRTEDGLRATKAIGRAAGDGNRLYVNLSECLGTNEGLGSVETMSIDFGDSGVTSNSDSFDKAGNVVSFLPVGGTPAADAYEITLSIETLEDDEPLEATLLLKITGEAP